MTIQKKDQPTTESTMTPREIVAELDKYIIGQEAAKRALAITLRSRYRRMQVEPALRKEITPKNILMIGPTGVGKTELARRLAYLVKAPFIKIEATKFTEVGYVGRDVESIIRDLIKIAVKMVREEAMKKVNVRAEEAAEERVLDAILPTPRKQTEDGKEEAENTATRKLFREKLRTGKIDDKEIEIDIAQTSKRVEIFGPPGMEEMTSQLQNMMQNMAPDRKRLKKMRVKDAMKLIKEEEAAKLINEEEIIGTALDVTEQNAIVFIDEFDKIVRTTPHGGEVSREGVQRDLLPLIEGTSVSTNYGIVKTDHILFIASGAFQLTKPSDLIPELQGRLPIRVELNALTTKDFIRILKEPQAALTEQYKALLKTEGLELEFTEDGINAIAEIACHVNERTENIGARRLHTIMERLLESTSYEACDQAEKKVTVDRAFVESQLNTFVKDEDLSRYIL